MSKFLGYPGLFSCKYCTNKMDLIGKIPQLNKKHVHINNPDKFNEILKQIIEDGPSKLQVLSDFDKTITKQHDNGKTHLSSFGIFEKCPSLTDEFVKTVDGLNKKYYPMEMDPHIPLKEKYQLMEEWWGQSENALRGLVVSPKEMEVVCKQLGPSLRDGTNIAFDMLHQEEVPVLVFSAGLGDIVKLVLNQKDVLLPNVKIVSNFLKYNSEGVIEGFTAPAIHVFNKNEYAIKNTEFYNCIIDRTNVILLGDSIGDAKMAEGITHVNNVLKIGFLYERKEEALPHYLDTFDVVLEDDQTMDVFISLLKCIFEKKLQI
ncbi:unnamed protein product [Brassicogethes aeneus]|uniref:5'-nucleotidase n=1 Tax=Brassicogethes aeneus TaxID=1431903 RepID=A0A9P0BCD2_BRAAE|nr:unnamed protein product [Brassicogethes aeneus]